MPNSPLIFKGVNAQMIPTGTILLKDGSPISVPKYATFAALPAVANEGDTALAIDTGVLYIYYTGSWQVAAAPGVILLVGALNGQPKVANAATVNANTIYLQSADATWPGVLTAADWTTFNSKLTSSLANGNIFVGNAGNVATSVAMSGDATIINTGALTIANLAVTNAKIANATIDLTTKVTGILPLANGGTNKNMVAVNGGIVYTDADSQEVSAAGSVGQVLQSGGAGAPTWSTPTYPSASGAAGQILRSDGTNNVYSTATFPNTAAQYDLLYASAANTWSLLAKQNTSALVTSAAGVPSWASGSTANRLLRTDGTTVSFAQADLTTDVSGVLPVANGGTNKNSWTAGSIVFVGAGGTAFTENTGFPFSWDNTNSRLNVGAAGTGKINVTAAGGADLGINVFSTAANNAVQIQNQSGYSLALVNAAASAVAGASIGGAFSRGTLAAKTQSLAGDQLLSLSAQGYTGAVQGPGLSGAISFVATENTTATANGGSLVFSTTPNTTLAPVSRVVIGQNGVVNISNLTASLPVQTDASKNLISAAITLSGTQVTGILPLANGGTNKNMTPVNGGIVYTDADSQEVSAAGSSGQLLRSAGAAAPTWTTATFPATAGASGNILVSDGTNWSSVAVSSDATLANTGALTIANSAVTNAKMANMAAHTIKANITAGAAAPVDSSLTAILDAELSSTQGVVVYRGAATWAALSPGINGQFLQTQGAAANPQWAAGGSGSVGAGVAGRLAVYPASTNSVDDAYVQNANDINLFIANHVGLAATRTYTIPDSGTDASFVMTEGAQTLNAVKTFSAIPLFKLGIDIEDPGAGTNKVSIVVPAALAASYTLTLPVDDGLSGQVLSTDGSGVLSWLAFTNLTDGDKGDITVSGTGTVWTIDNDVVTYAKMQNVSATDRLLGRSTAGAGDVEEIVCTAAGRALIDDANAAAQRVTLGVDIGVDVQAFDPQLSSLIRQNSQSAAYTTVLTDGGKHIYHPTADNNARTFTIDSNANVAYPIGTAITFVNEINTVTIAITSDTLVLSGPGTTGSRTLAANGMATALKIGTTRWIISGTGLT